MGVTVKKNFGNLTDTVEWSVSDWRAVGNLIVRRITARTMQGIDVDNATFRRYSERYAETRKKSGLRTDIVNLQVSGQMLGGMIVTPVKLGVKVSFRD
jgi:uncharacterized protein YdhG (YjbR/CyaY superfamily)